MRPTSETCATLRGYFNYDQLTGVLTWATNKGKVRKGAIAGTLLKGYMRVQLNGQFYQVHAVAWCWMTGEWPPKGYEVDHKDLIRSNNAWDNLRLGTRSQNLANLALSPKNTTGFKGVTWHKQRKKWAAHISINNKFKHLGLFATAELAHGAYCDAALARFGEFARMA